MSFYLVSAFSFSASCMQRAAGSSDQASMGVSRTVAPLVAMLAVLGAACSRGEPTAGNDDRALPTMPSAGVKNDPTPLPTEPAPAAPTTAAAGLPASAAPAAPSSGPAPAAPATAGPTTTLAPSGDPALDALDGELSQLEQEVASLDQAVAAIQGLNK